MAGKRREDEQASPQEPHRGVQGGVAERKAAVDPERDLPIQKQAEALEIRRRRVYYQPRPVSEPDHLHAYSSC
jgi:hypothetical protein